MTTEELLQPRFKVIATYPNSFLDIGEIIKNNFSSFDLNDYPNLFRKLEWWEDREIEDLPEYLKDKKEVYKVYKYAISYSMVSVKVYEKSGYILTLFLYNVLPSNKEEYETNNNI